MDMGLGAEDDGVSLLESAVGAEDDDGLELAEEDALDSASVAIPMPALATSFNKSPPGMEPITLSNAPSATPPRAPPAGPAMDEPSAPNPTPELLSGIDVSSISSIFKV